MSTQPKLDKKTTDTTPKGVEVIKLSREITYEDETLTELSMNFDALTGDDIEGIEREWIAGGGGSGVAELSKTYLMHVVARASGQRIEVIKKLPLKDVSKATVLAQNFLLA